MTLASPVGSRRSSHPSRRHQCRHGVGHSGGAGRIRADVSCPRPGRTHRCRCRRCRVSGDDVGGAGRGPADRRARGVDINAVDAFGTAAVPAALVPMSVALDQAGRVDVDAVVRVSGDDIGVAGRGPADRRARAVDINAVAAFAHSGGAGRIRADLVALHQAGRDRCRCRSPCCRR